MSSKTSMVAADFRLQEWAAQIRECQSRPAGMSVVDWCACLETIQEEIPAQQMVLVQPGLLQQEQKDRNTQPGLDISIKGVCIHVTESTSMPLLTEVLKAVQHAQQMI